MFDDHDGETPMLEKIRQLLPEIAAAADETERNRGVDPALIDRLGEAGMFRIMLPKSYGGEDLDCVQSMRVAEEMAYADMSVGWTIMVTAGLNLNLAIFPRETIDEVLASGPDARMRGVTAPKGRLVPVEGGYRLSGQWAFASGSFAPDWVVAAAFVYDGDEPRMIGNAFDYRLALVPGDKVRFLDTWNVVGLCGTASHDFAIDDLFVPENYVAKGFSEPNLVGPAYRVHASVAGTAHHAGVRLGSARATLDELARLAEVKRSSFDPRLILIDDPYFQSHFGKLVVRLDAVRAHAYTVMRQLWEKMDRGMELQPSDSLRARCMLTHISEETVDIVTEAFRLASSASIYNNSALQRRMRDMQVAAQHAAGAPGAYALMGTAYVREAVEAAAD